ncbi:hypothetical protein JCM6882_006786 [Rhodosporidiobolus microsporus]
MGSWLSRPREPDYDTYLSKLQEQISARQAKLQQIRLRERRANALLLTWAIGLWVFYTVLWYLGVVRFRLNGGALDQVVSAAPVLVVPVLIVFVRRFVRWFYHRKQDKEASELKTLVKQKQDKVEEIKKKTGYYSTRDLLEKYDEALKKSAGPPGTAPGTPATQPGPKPGAKPSIPFPSAPGTPARPASALGFSTPQQQQQQQQQLQSRGPQPPSAFPAPPGPIPPPQSPGTPHRTFMDKFADALLGVSPEEMSPNKYALICGRCFAHNGLVPPEQFDFVQYQCPRCGFFNPRRRDPPSSSQQQPFHRRVVSEMAPSPLSYPAANAASASTASSLLAGGDPPKLERLEAERAEEREVAETLLPEQDVGEGEGGTGAGARRRGETSTTAMQGGTVAQKRRGRRNVGSDDEGEGEKEDRMDTD